MTLHIHRLASQGLEQQQHTLTPDPAPARAFQYSVSQVVPVDFVGKRGCETGYLSLQ
jgi:hypothetical protein